MPFFWDNLGRKDIIRSLISAVFQPRTLTGSKPFSILKCLDATKFVLLRLFTLIETICAKNCIKSRLVNAKVYVRLMCVTQKCRSFNSLITRWTDRIIPNFFTVFQILLEIAIAVSLRDYWRFSKEVDYSLICVSTMHHPEHCQFCINCSFLFWYRTTLFMLICILKDPVMQRWSTFSYTFPPC